MHTVVVRQGLDLTFAWKNTTITHQSSDRKGPGLFCSELGPDSRAPPPTRFVIRDVGVLSTVLEVATLRRISI